MVAEATDWLERNRDHPNVFLWMDSFDPHEPWDPPRAFDHYTDPAYRGRRLIMPMGGRASDWADEREVQHIRGLYAGEAESVDAALGPLFEALERLGYYEDSLILVVADHGHPLADHGKFLKGADRLYNELLQVPFLLRLPGGRRGGTRVGAMVQYHDVLPTLFDLMGLSGETEDMHGRSFRALVDGTADAAPAGAHRTACITGYHAGVDRVVRAAGVDGDGRNWSLILRPEGEPDELYDLDADPSEAHQPDRRPPSRSPPGWPARFGPTYFRRQERLQRSRACRGRTRSLRAPSSKRKPGQHLVPGRRRPPVAPEDPPSTGPRADRAPRESGAMPGRLKAETPVRPVAVVGRDVLGQDRAQVPLVEGDHAVEALGAEGPAGLFRRSRSPGARRSTASPRCRLTSPARD